MDGEESARVQLVGEVAQDGGGFDAVEERPILANEAEPPMAQRARYVSREAKQRHL